MGTGMPGNSVDQDLFSMQGWPDGHPDFQTGTGALSPTPPLFLPLRCHRAQHTVP